MYVVPIHTNAEKEKQKKEGAPLPDRCKKKKKENLRIQIVSYFALYSTLNPPIYIPRGTDDRGTFPTLWLCVGVFHVSHILYRDEMFPM